MISNTGALEVPAKQVHQKKHEVKIWYGSIHLPYPTAANKTSTTMNCTIPAVVDKKHVFYFWRFCACFLFVFYVFYVFYKFLKENLIVNCLIHVPNASLTSRYGPPPLQEQVMFCAHFLCTLSWCVLRKSVTTILYNCHRVPQRPSESHVAMSELRNSICGDPRVSQLSKFLHT